MWEVLPVNYKIIVEIDEKEEYSEGGILMTTTNRDREKFGSDIGRVVHIGKTAYKDEAFGGQPEFKVGDKVCFIRYTGYTVPTEDGTLRRALTDSDIIGVVVEKEDK